MRELTHACVKTNNRDVQPMIY